MSRVVCEARMPTQRQCACSRQNVGSVGMRAPAFSLGPCPTVMERRKRSLVSSTRRQVMVAGSMSSRANLRPQTVALYKSVGM